MGLRGRGIRETWPRTLPGSSRTLLPKFSLIGGTVGKMIFGCWSSGVGVGVIGWGAWGLSGTWHKTLPGFWENPMS